MRPADADIAYWMRTRYAAGAAIQVRGPVPYRLNKMSNQK